MLSTRRQRAIEAEVAVNMSRFHEIGRNSQENPTGLANYFNVLHGDQPMSQPRSNLSNSQQSANGDFVKPNLPEFLQNMGPGIRTLKENPPVTLSWYDIRAQAPSKQGIIKRKLNQCLGKEVQGPKDLLKGVSGIVHPGQMCAIMGASGAGKTTLMNILTHRRTGNLRITNDVRINGRKMKSDISGVSGFVQQDELFIGTLTVREHLRFHAMLRLGKEFTEDERTRRIDEILDFLNLTKAQDTTIGIPGIVKGLSGGEKRRLTFATEIINDPPMLFCDEPTTGLDAAMAFIIVRAMRKLADLGKTIICTIHQPSSEIFFLFDRLYLLAEGRLAYFGSLEKATPFFRQFGLEIPPNYNPSDFYIQQLAIYPKTKEENLAQIHYICDEYEKSPQHARYIAEVVQLHANYQDDEELPFVARLFYNWSPFKEKSEKDNPNDDDVQNRKRSRYATNGWTQFRWLVWRTLVNIFKNPFEIQLRLILAIFLGVMIGLLYIRLDYDETAPQNMNSLLFLIIVNTSFGNIFAVTQSYTREYPIFYKDHDDAVYRVAPYYFAKFITELPLFALTTLIQGAIAYWMTNLFASAKRFFLFISIITLTSFASVGLGSVISVAANSPEQAQAVQIPILLPLMIFGGFFLNNESGKEWITWIKYISWFFYANEALVINQWTDVESLPCSNSTGGRPCLSSGDAVIQFTSYDKSNFERNIGLIALLWIAFRLLSFFILMFKAKHHK